MVAYPRPGSPAADGYRTKFAWLPVRLAEHRYGPDLPIVGQWQCTGRWAWLRQVRFSQNIITGDVMYHEPIKPRTN